MLQRADACKRGFGGILLLFFKGINSRTSKFESSLKLSRRCTYVHYAGEEQRRPQQDAANHANLHTAASAAFGSSARCRVPLRVTTFTVSRRLINTLTRASRQNNGHRFRLLHSVLPLSVNRTSAPPNEEVQGCSAGRQVCTITHLPLGCLLPWSPRDYPCTAHCDVFMFVFFFFFLIKFDCCLVAL